MAEIGKGLELFARAQKLAERLGNGSVSESLGNSILLYRLQFGLDGEGSVMKAERKLRTLLPEDTYTESSFLLELARQALFRGNGARAKEYLDRASRVIFATQNRRHEIILNLRFAGLLQAGGDTAQALNYIRSARALLHAGVDRSLEIELLTVEWSVSESLGWGARIEALRIDAEKFLKIPVGTAAERALARIAGRSERVAVWRPGMDPFGDLLDELWGAEPGKVSVPLRDCVEKGYFGLLPRALGLSPGVRAIYLDWDDRRAFFFDRTTVEIHSGMTPQLRTVVGLLASGPRSKEELVRAVWGYAYHPLRHDPLVYQSMNQLRKVFGAFSDWIVNTESGYGLSREVRVLRFGLEPVDRAVPELIVKDAAENVPVSAALNLRQRKILRIAAKKEALDVRTLFPEFKVTPLTLSRDLAFLSRLGLLSRIGRGRATQYVLASDSNPV